MPFPARILGLTALLALSLPDPAGGQPGFALARGDSLMAALATPRAIEAYREGLVESPDDPVLLWRAARAISNRTAETPGMEGDEPLHQEAVELARRAVAAAPDVARTHTTLATALGRYGHWMARECRVRCAGRVVDMGKEGYRATRRAIALDPYDPAPFIVLGLYHRDLSTVPLVVKVIARTFLGGYPPVSLEASARNLERAVRLDPEDVTAHLELARTYAEMDRDDDARVQLGAALAAPTRERLDLVEKEQARRLRATLE
jgi:tetratricopeptide (TPR) repeat protein